jgi:multidrug resistance efflux pump
METKENNNTASTHQEKARKLKKLRRWQIVVSLLGIAILIWGIIQVVCLFLNYKRTETSNDAQIENLHLGQEVVITVDAISDKEFKGKITAISGATGSKYSLVPTDNSAGNFVKIQQRIPVRIDFTDLSKEDNSSLAAGMMVIVKAKME